MQPRLVLEKKYTAGRGDARRCETVIVTRRFLGAALLGLSVGRTRAAEPNALSDQELSEGWDLLFDGESAQGWTEITGKPFPSGCWTIQDGCLKTLPGAGGRQDIRTEETFRSFDLQFEWRITADGNSGVKYLIQRVDEWMNDAGRQARARGLEYQLADDAGPEATADPRRTAASLYAVIAPSPRIAPAIDAFNHTRIVLDGERVEHWLNGTKVVGYQIPEPAVQDRLRAQFPPGRDPDAPFLRESPISLQHHTSEVWFRSIKVRRPA